MRFTFFVLSVFLPSPLIVFAQSADDMRLANPPAFRLMCLPGATSAVLEPVRLGKIPTDTKQQQAFVKLAARQGIVMGMAKVGPFEDDAGELKAACTLGPDTITVHFRYINYPDTRAPDGKQELMSEGQCDVLTRLDLIGITLNGKPWAEHERKSWPGFLHSCRDPEVTRLTLSPSRNKIELCELSSGGDIGARLDTSEASKTVSCQTITPAQR